MSPVMQIFALTCFKAAGMGSNLARFSNPHYEVQLVEQKMTFKSVGESD